MPPKAQKVWEQAQMKAFTKWVNSHLNKKGLAIEKLTEDFQDGVRLIRLLESLGDESLGKFNQKPKMRIHKIENLNKALAFIKGRNVALHSIGSEDILDGNTKLTLGLVWTLILRFEIADISVEEMSAKEGLLRWCQRKTEGYRAVDVKNFTFSWQDGMAFNALIHRHKPGMIDYESLDPKNRIENLNNAFDVAEKLGIPRFLDAEDMCEVKPDERSVMTYLVQFFKLFADSQKTEVAARRVGKLVAFAQSIDELKAEYDADAKKLVEWIDGKIPELNEREFDNTLEGAREKVDHFEDYINGEKVQKNSDRLAVITKLNNLNVKLKSAGRASYAPPEGLGLDDIGNKWTDLENSEGERRKALAEELARQEKLDGLVKRFNQKATKLESWDDLKQAYLDAREVIDTVNAAQGNIKLLDGYDGQYEDSKPRVSQLKELGQKIIDLDYKEKDQIQERMDKIDGLWDKLASSAGEKRTWLEEELAKQEKMEKLRIEFAEKAKDLSLWYKNTNEALGTESFGDTLEEVQDYKTSVMDQKESDLLGESDEKKKDLLRVWDEMQEMDIKENQYTELTVEDIEAGEEALKAAIGKWKDAYDEELKRQEAMEAKRKEFAEAAENFVTMLEEQKNKVDALTGEPDELTEQIVEVYQDSAPQKEGLDNLNRIRNEAIAMHITENKYTTHTVPQLKRKSADFSTYVKNYKNELAEEKRRKFDYNERAGKLLAWIDETLPTLENRDTENNLSDARKKLAEFKSYRSAVKPPKTADKSTVLTLFKSIVSFLAASKHNRPEFTPDEGKHPDDINATWTKLEEIEKAREDWIITELKRQEKLDKWQKQFRQEAKEMEDFYTKKEEYLQKEEVIETLSDAQIQLNLIANYSREYATSVERLDALKKLGGQIVEDDYIEKDDIQAKMDDLDGKWAKLKELEDTKKQVLDDALAREEKREEFRLEFAKKAKAYTAWITRTIAKTGVRKFGDSLEAVEAHKEVKEADDSKITGESEEFKNDLDDVWAKMQEMEITSNVHTKLTNEDIAASHQKLMDAIAARTEDYDKELERQQNMENKRLEFAKAAQDFVDWLAAEREAVDAMTGEPEPLTEEIKGRYQEGQPQKEKLDDLSRIHQEAIMLEITENRHTEHTVPLLKGMSKEYDDYIASYIEELEDERARKARYAEEADALLAWIEEAIQELETYEPENTLASAQKLDAEHKQYLTTRKARKVADRDRLAKQYNEIVDMLAASTHNRPEIAPAENHTPESIDASMQKLADTEKSLEEKLTTELARQEKLTKQASEFDEENDRLVRFYTEKEEYLEVKEEVDTVNTAQIQLDLLGAYSADYQASLPDVESFKNLGAEITGDNYVESDRIKEAMADIDAKWAKLQELETAKKAVLEGDLEREEKSEDMRLKFADLIKDFERYTNDSVEGIEQYEFGVTLEAVTEYKEKKEANDAELTEEMTKRNDECVALAKEMESAGVVDNVHTPLTTEDCADFVARVNTAIENRTGAYEEELARQQAMEDKRLEWAKAADVFVETVDNVKTQLDAVSGEPEDKKEEVVKIFDDGSAHKEKLDECARIDGEAKEMGIVKNPHSSLTITNVQNKSTQHEKYYKNLLSAIDEEKVMKDRRLEKEAEWKRRAEIEELKNKYNKNVQALFSWIDGADEIMSQGTTANSVEEVDSLVADFAKIQEEKTTQEGVYGEIKALADELQEKGDEVAFDSQVTPKWEECLKELGEYDEELKKEKEVQDNNERLRSEFAELAVKFHSWIASEDAESKKEEGGLEDQLAHLQKCLDSIKAGESQLNEVDALAVQLNEAGVKENPHTTLTKDSLTAEYEGLRDDVEKRAGTVENQILQKKMSGVSPEELKEFSDVFHEFDKDNSGNLEWYEFKGVLAGLGEDLDDDQVKAIVAEHDNDGDGKIDFDEFIKFMVKRRTDQDSPEEISNAFAAIANGKDWVTVDDMAPCMQPAEVEYLKNNMKPYTGEGAPEGALDYKAWTTGAFS